MTEFVIAVVCVVLGIVIGWRSRERYARFVIEKYFKQSDNAASKDDIINVEIMKEKDSYYVYNTLTGAFITQVKSKEELLKYLETHFSEKTVMIKKEHFALFDTL
jgi:hypothetical protein